MRVRPRKSARHSRTQHLFAALVPALIVTFSITGFVWAQQQVTVVVDGHSKVVQTQASDVAGALADAHVALDEDDVVSPARDTAVSAGMTIVVRHSVPVVLDLGGQRIDLDVVGVNVADALVAAGIDPAANPAVDPPLQTALKPRMVIGVPDVFLRVVREEADVPFGVRKQSDKRLLKGQSKVVSNGAPGRVLRVYRIVVANGVETSPVLTAEHVLVKPKPQVVAVGAKSPKRSPIAAIAARALAAPPKAGRRLRVLATGYSGAQPDLDNTTATGARARRGVVAVDPSRIPLGTRLFVPGYGYAIAADTGGAIHGSRIDLCFDTVAEARAWGRRRVTIIVLD